MKAEPQFDLKCDETSVELWTAVRLPYGSKEEKMRDARDLLRQALRNMVPKPGQILTATYRSLDQSFCDVENVLLYNVGAGAFTALATNGLQFSRSHMTPPDSPCGRTFDHYHEYRLVDMVETPTRRPDCSFSFALTSLTSSTKPHKVWFRASDAQVERATELKGDFAIRTVLRFPTQFYNLTSVVKSLLDGVISALHTDTNLDHEAVTRLAKSTDWEPADIIQRLRSPNAPVLGPRRLLHTYRDFVKWNPADERCHACTVVHELSSSPTCSVELWDRYETC